MANENGWGDASANNDIGWGQAANNDIGWGDVYSKSAFGLTDIIGTVANKTDVDVAAFLEATAITDETITSAINGLVTDLKDYEIWTKLNALYPFVGGTATTHKFNLIDPQDTDGAYRLVFSGGVTHNSNGVTFNGTNGYANTKLNDQSILNINSKHIAMYQRNILSDPTGSSMGIGNSNRFYLNYGGNNYSALGMAQAPFTAQTPLKGLFIMNKTASGSFSYIQNDLTPVTKTGTNASQNLNYFIGACNTVGSPFDYTASNIAFASIGQGLSDTDISNFKKAINSFQTTLSRNV